MTAEDGKVRVERTDDVEGALRLSMRALSAIFTGYASPRQLALAGMLAAGHPSEPFVTALFAGPMPWMLDHF